MQGNFDCIRKVTTLTRQICQRPLAWSVRSGSVRNSLPESLLFGIYRVGDLVEGRNDSDVLSILRVAKEALTSLRSVICTSGSPCSGCSLLQKPRT